MRSVVASVMVLGLLTAPVASASAASRHRAPVRYRVTADPNPRVVAPGTPSATSRFSVPGWSDESTARWLNNASALVGVGG